MISLCHSIQCPENRITLDVAPSTFCPPFAPCLAAALRLDSRTFEKPLRQHRCKLLIPRGGICRSEGSEYICLMNREIRLTKRCRYDTATSEAVVSLMI